MKQSATTTNTTTNEESTLTPEVIERILENKHIYGQRVLLLPNSIILEKEGVEALVEAILKQHAKFWPLTLKMEGKHRVKRSSRNGSPSGIKHSRELDILEDETYLSDIIDYLIHNLPSLDYFKFANNGFTSAQCFQIANALRVREKVVKGLDMSRNEVTELFFSQLAVALGRESLLINELKLNHCGFNVVVLKELWRSLRGYYHPITISLHQNDLIQKKDVESDIKHLLETNPNLLGITFDGFAFGKEKILATGFKEEVPATTAKSSGSAIFESIFGFDTESQTLLQESELTVSSFELFEKNSGEVNVNPAIESSKISLAKSEIDSEKVALETTFLATEAVEFYPTIPAEIRLSLNKEFSSQEEEMKELSTSKQTTPSSSEISAESFSQASLDSVTSLSSWIASDPVGVAKFVIAAEPKVLEESINLSKSSIIPNSVTAIDPMANQDLMHDTQSDLSLDASDPLSISEIKGIGEFPATAVLEKTPVSVANATLNSSTVSQEREIVESTMRDVTLSKRNSVLSSSTRSSIALDNAQNNALALEQERGYMRIKADGVMMHGKHYHWEQILQSIQAIEVAKETALRAISTDYKDAKEIKQKEALLSAPKALYLEHFDLHRLPNLTIEINANATNFDKISTLVKLLFVQEEFYWHSIEFVNQDPSEENLRTLLELLKLQSPAKNFSVLKLQSSLQLETLHQLKTLFAALAPRELHLTAKPMREATNHLIELMMSNRNLYAVSFAGYHWKKMMFDQMAVLAENKSTLSLVKIDYLPQHLHQDYATLQQMLSQRNRTEGRSYHLLKHAINVQDIEIIYSLFVQSSSSSIEYRNTAIEYYDIQREQTVLEAELNYLTEIIEKLKDVSNKNHDTKRALLKEWQSNRKTLQTRMEEMRATWCEKIDKLMFQVANKTFYHLNEVKTLNPAQRDQVNAALEKEKEIAFSEAMFALEALLIALFNEMQQSHFLEKIYQNFTLPSAITHLLKQCSNLSEEKIKASQNAKEKFTSLGKTHKEILEKWRSFQHKQKAPRQESWWPKMEGTDYILSNQNPKVIALLNYLIAGDRSHEDSQNPFKEMPAEEAAAMVKCLMEVGVAVASEKSDLPLKTFLKQPDKAMNQPQKELENKLIQPLSSAAPTPYQKVFPKMSNIHDHIYQVLMRGSKRLHPDIYQSNLSAFDKIAEVFFKNINEQRWNQALDAFSQFYIALQNANNHVSPKDALNKMQACISLLPASFQAEIKPQLLMLKSHAENDEYINVLLEMTKIFEQLENHRNQLATTSHITISSVKVDKKLEEQAKEINELKADKLEKTKEINELKADKLEQKKQIDALQKANELREEQEKGTNTLLELLKKDYEARHGLGSLSAASASTFAERYQQSVSPEGPKTAQQR